MDIKKIILVIGINLMMVTTAFSLGENIPQILQDIGEDADKYLEGYLSPIGDGYAIGMGSAWWLGSTKHKKFGFDFTLGTSIINVKNISSFTYNNEASNDLTIRPTGTTENPATQSGIPTIAGGSNPNLKMHLLKNPALQTNGLPVVPGIGVKRFVLPYFQAGLGLPKGLLVKIRLMPRFRYYGLKVGWMYGGALIWNMKEGMKWKKMPIDIIIGLSYSTLSVTSEASVEDVVVNSSTQSASFALDSRVNTFSTNFGISKTVLKILTLYGGGIFSGGTSKALITTRGLTESPHDIKIKYSPSLWGGIIGSHVTFGVFRISAEYTIQTVPVGSIGLGVSLR